MNSNINKKKIFEITNVLHRNDELGTVCGIAEDDELGECFVKIINYGKFSEAKAKNISRDMAKKEAEILERVSKSSNAVPKLYYCFDDTKTQTFTIVMQKMQGISLTNWMKCHPVSKMDAKSFFARRKIIQQICEIMQRIKVVHRDLKPDNILIRLENGRWMVSIVDFGCAGLDFVRKVGTARYCAPEQSELYCEKLSINFGEETDIFAIGQIYYELLLGYAPTFGKDYICSSSEKRWEKRPTLNENLIKMPDGRDIEDILTRMTGFDPKERKYDIEYSDIISVLNKKHSKKR